MSKRTKILSCVAWGIVCWVAGATVGGETAAPPTPRDWKTFPAVAVVEWHKTEDIYAIGDMHGDFEKASRLLKGAGLMAEIPADPKKAEWAAGKSVLVCPGDMIDKWTASVEILEMMRALQASAEKKGGCVVVTLGNHEAEFLAGAVSAKGETEFEKELAARGIDPKDVAAGRDAEGLGMWLRERPVAAKVGGWFFCHAGNTFDLSVKEIEAAVEAGVDKEGYGTSFLAQPNSILQARMGSAPWWVLADAANNPQLPAATEPERSGARRLKAYAAALGCEHLVVGHQPGKVSFGNNVERAAGTMFAYEGVLFLIDTGLSRGAQDGQGRVLRIHWGTKEEASAVDEAGKETALWSGK